MSLFTSIMSGLSLIASPVTEWIKGRQAQKQAVLDSKLAINEAKTNASITKILNGQQADIAWENTQIANSGWKDEYWTVILTVPLIMVFIPGMEVYVYKGFDALEKCPKWYQWAIGVSVAASFGYKKIADFMALRKGD